MSRGRWLLSVIGWDGCLPVLVATAPAVLPVVLPNRALAAVVAALGVPIVAALVRARHGHRQLDELPCGATMNRQVLFGFAIVALLFCEIMVGILRFAPFAPRSMWFTVGGVYLAYLALVVAALRPPWSARADWV
jgi:hypothetical protein